MSHKFIGGVHIAHSHSNAETQQSNVLPAPDMVYIPMSMHIGAPCTPCVAVGDEVKLGQKIGDCPKPVSAPVHSSVSGKVTAIESRLTSLGTKCTYVVIENDHMDTPCETMQPCDENDPDAIVAAIRECGIVGMGGATFPTAFKITSGRGKVHTVIINGSECEPFIASDHRAMLENSDEILEGIRLVCKACGVEKAVLVIENNKADAIELLKSKAKDIEIMGVPTRYPQGAEKQLIHTVTGDEVPPGGLPAAVGCNVFNVETCLAVYDAVKSGRPLIDRYVTVYGSAIKEPMTFIARVGTPIRCVFDAAGGFVKDPQKIVMGGPMMGMAQFDLDVPVNKGTNGLLAFCEDEDKHHETYACIRCGRCAEACPMRLQPTYLYMFAEKNDLDKLEEYNVMDCIECGACTYSCPARLPLTHSCKTGKLKIQTRNAERKAKAEAEAAAKAAKEAAK